MEFPGLLKKYHVEFPGILKTVEFPRVIKKNHVEFPRVLVFNFGISKGGITEFCGILRDEALFILKFPEGM